MVFKARLAQIFAMVMSGAMTIPAAYAQSMVVNATGPSASSHPKGKKLPANARITLKAQDRVTVVDAAGTRVLKGPGTFVLDGRIRRDRNILAGLTRSMKGVPAVRAGAVRGGGSERNRDGATAKLMRTSLWFADIDQGGRICYVQDQGLLLTRSDTAQGRHAWIGMSDGGAMTRLYWAPRTLGIGWPEAATPVGNGYSYRLISRSGDTQAPAADETVTEITLTELEAAPDNNMELAALLLENGCQIQFDALISAMPAEDSGATGNPAG